MLLSWRLTFASSNARRLPVAYRLSVRFQSFLSGRSQMAFFGLVVFFSPVMASASQGDTDRIDRNIHNELLAEGEMRGPARRDKKLRSLGLTRAKAGLHSSYASGDTVIYRTSGQSVCRAGSCAHRCRDGRTNSPRPDGWGTPPGLRPSTLEP